LFYLQVIRETVVVLLNRIGPYSWESIRMI